MGKQKEKMIEILKEHLYASDGDERVSANAEPPKDQSYYLRVGGIDQTVDALMAWIAEGEA